MGISPDADAALETLDGPQLLDHASQWKVTIEETERVIDVRLEASGTRSMPGLDGALHEFHEIRVQTNRTNYRTWAVEPMEVPYFFHAGGLASHWDPPIEVLRLHPDGIQGLSWYAERSVLVAVLIERGLLPVLDEEVPDDGERSCRWQRVDHPATIHACMEGDRVHAVRDEGPLQTTAVAEPQAGPRLQLRLEAAADPAPVFERAATRSVRSGTLELQAPPIGDAWRTDDDLEALLVAAAAAPPHLEYSAAIGATGHYLYTAFWTGISNGLYEMVTVRLADGERLLNLMMFEDGQGLGAYTPVVTTGSVLSYETGVDAEAVPREVVPLEAIQRHFGADLDIGSVDWHAIPTRGTMHATWTIAERCQEQEDPQYRIVDATTGALLIHGTVLPTDGGACPIYFPLWPAAEAGLGWEIPVSTAHNALGLGQSS